jgi:hypothetical protein
MSSDSSSSELSDTIQPSSVENSADQISSTEEKLDHSENNEPPVHTQPVIIESSTSAPSPALTTSSSSEVVSSDSTISLTSDVSDSLTPEPSSLLVSSPNASGLAISAVSTVLQSSLSSSANSSLLSAFATVSSTSSFVPHPASIGIIKSNEKDEVYWQRQDQRFQSLITRIERSNQSSSELFKWIKACNRALQKAGELLQEIPEAGGSESGSLREAFKTVEIIKKTTIHYLSELRERVFNEGQSQAATLSKVVEKRFTGFTEKGLRIARDVKIEREIVKATWNNYEQARGIQQNTGGKAGKLGDPFIYCRQFERELMGVRGKEAKYRTEMSALVNELKREEQKRIEASKRILMDQLIAQKAVFTHLLKFTDDAIQRVQCVNGELDVEEFLKEAQLKPTLNELREAKLDSLAQPPVTIFEMPPPNRDQALVRQLYETELEREGILFRPGKIIKTNWKEIYSAVTRSGYLHYFDDATAAQPSSSISLTTATVNPLPSLHPCAFEVLSPSTSIFSSTPTQWIFRTDSEFDSKCWIEAIRKYSKPSPNLSHQSSLAPTTSQVANSPPTPSSSARSPSPSDQASSDQSTVASSRPDLVSEVAEK